jgi:hypothetical protein
MILCSCSYTVVTTVAGSGVASFGDGAGSQAGFNQPIGVAVDASGTVYVAAYNAPRKINPAGGAHTFAHSVTSVVHRCCHHVSNGHDYDCYPCVYD